MSRSPTPPQNASVRRPSKTPTMEDVAAAAGVSRALVSLVMRNSPKVSATSRTKILDAAEQLGYRPNLMARNLASQRTNTFGLLLNDLHNPFFAELADGVHVEAEAAGYQVVINTGFGRPDGERAAAARFLEYRVDGMLMVGTRIADAELLALAQECRLVVVGKTLDSPTVDSVNNDESVGARLAIDHLVELGHSDIAHIDGGDGAGAAGRRRGYVAAMKANGIGERARVIDGDFTEAAGIAGVDRLIADDRPLSAIFCANDLMATGALHRLDELGITVPTEISVVGYDNTALAGLGHIQLSTVNQPRELMGQLAARLLVDRIESGAAPGTHQVLAPSFVGRATTGPAR